MNDHDCHAMDKPILGCQLLNKEILYSDYFNVKTSRFNWFNFQKFTQNRCFYSKIHQNLEYTGDSSGESVVIHLNAAKILKMIFPYDPSM